MSIKNTAFKLIIVNIAAFISLNGMVYAEDGEHCDHHKGGTHQPQKGAHLGHHQQDTEAKHKPKTNNAQTPQKDLISDYSVLNSEFLSKLQLKDQEGKLFTGSTLKGKLWVVSFIFTRCQGPCPMMTQKMKSLEEGYKDIPEVKFVSVSVDPEYDTPAKLKEYGIRYKVNFDRWSFLTGDKARIIELATKAFEVPAGEDPNMHGTKFVLVDDKGVIRGQFDPNDRKSLWELRKAIGMRLNYLRS